ncbi:STAS domain-containing protein [Deinococcus pimensis]|uniref:STAS domain-containing protein n=1 Tax=Deinococcus pimensis TaxID=309888 RepID=UPI0005EB7516|nr:STAS domain-containing protein [Deinococcus pimensis]
MEVTVERQGEVAAVITLAGRLDLVSAAAAKRGITDAVAQGARRLVVDLHRVTFIDSSGLSSLVAALKAARQAGGDLRIARPNEQALVILQMTTLDRVLTPFPTVEEALRGYDGQQSDAGNRDLPGRR